MALIPPPSSVTLTSAQKAVQGIAVGSRQTFGTLLNNWGLTVKIFWKNRDSTPAENAAVMGTDAKANFEASAATAAYLSQFSQLTFTPEEHTLNLQKIAAVGALVGSYTVNSDGTITVA